MSRVNDFITEAGVFYLATAVDIPMMGPGEDLLGE